MRGKAHTREKPQPLDMERLQTVASQSCPSHEAAEVRPKCLVSLGLGTLSLYQTLAAMVEGILSMRLSSSLLFLFRILFVFSVSMIASWRPVSNKPASLASYFFLPSELRCIFLPTAVDQTFPFPYCSCKQCSVPAVSNTRCCRSSKYYLVIVLATPLKYC